MVFTGELHHARWSPVRNEFTYPVSWLVLDLDELESIASESLLFRHNRRAVVALHDRDYGDGLGAPLKSDVIGFARREGLAGDVARVELLTHPRTLGYVFNPVSFFYLYDTRDELLGVVTEINNTYGGRRRHLFDARNRLTTRRGHAYRQPKELYVSPFIAMDAVYHFHFFEQRDDDGAAFSREVRVDEFRGDEQFFMARLRGIARPLSDRTLASALVRYPLMTVQVIALIYWQALRLDRMGVARHPRPNANRARRTTPERSCEHR
jgi:DUF1365 family protein